MMQGMNHTSDLPVESVLREELARGDLVAESAGPVLRHLLANDDSSLFGDEVVARVRGMVVDLADQLLLALAEATRVADYQEFAELRRDALSTLLMDNGAMLAHLHALALEWQLAERLQARVSIDPVLTPLMQSLIASQDPQTAAQAMSMLAAQARFIQQQRRMELPIVELPGDLFHVAVISMRGFVSASEDCAAAKAEALLRETFDESSSRLGLASRILMGMGSGALSALSVAHSGVALFLTALGLASGQSRSAAMMATTEHQLARLALTLRAAGLKTPAIEEQFALIHPDVVLPEQFDELRADRAAALLAFSTPALGS